MLDVPLERARDLRNAFLYAQGARYVRALEARGGWAAVNSRYTFPPRSTAEVLHPEGVSAVHPGPGRTRGQYGLIALLASHPSTAPGAVRAAQGWRGDRLIEDGKSTAWIVAFATPEKALRFRAALAALRAARSPGVKAQERGPAETVWSG